MTNWDKIYTNHGVVQHKVDTFVERSLHFLNNCKITKVYDYGAGTGRNAIFLAERGFEVITYDPSVSSRELLNKARSNGLRDKISILKDPLRETNYVDCAMSICSVHHGNLKSIMESIDNLIMPVISGGIVMFKGLSESDPLSKCGLGLEERTRVDIPYWADGKIPHHFFNEKELKDLFSQTEIISLNEVSEPVEFFEDSHHYFELFGIKK